MKTKKLFLSFFLTSLFGGMAFSFDGDCLVVNGSQFNPENSFPLATIQRKDDTLKRTDIIDLASLNVALLNLQKRCCSTADFYTGNTTNCKKDRAYYENNNDKVLQSFSLFDHIYDVQRRRLAGEAGEEYLYKGVTLDKKAQERRERINQIAESFTGTAPLVINNKYNEFRKVDAQNLTTGFVQSMHKQFEEYTNDMETGANLAILQRYNELTLGERHENLCNITRYIYGLFLKDQSKEDKEKSEIRTRNTLTNPTLLKLRKCPQLSAHNLCTCQIKQGIENEANYVKNVITKRSNDLLKDNVTQFTNIYLANRLIDLEAIILEINKSLRNVERAVPKLTLSCMPA